MRKLSLSLDDLKVDSFETAAGGSRGGTVHARSGHVDQVHQSDSQDTIAGSGDMSCDTCQTCDFSMCESCWLVTCGTGEA